MLIEVRKKDNNHIIISNDNYGQIKCVGDESVLPDIGEEYIYLQWSDAAWYEKFWVDVNNNIQSFTEDQLSYLEDLITNWIQPVGQQGNPSFEQLVTAKFLDVETAYNNSNTIDIDYMDTTFQADKKSQDLVVSVLSAGSVPDGFYWMDKANNQVAMTFSDLQGLSEAILIRGQTNFVKLQSLKTDVRNATTQDDLDKITW